MASGQCRSCAWRQDSAGAVPGAAAAPRWAAAAAPLPTADHNPFSSKLCNSEQDSILNGSM